MPGVFICRSEKTTGRPGKLHEAFQEFLDLAPEPVGTVQLLACPGLCLLKRDPTRSQSGDAPVIFGNFVPPFP